jgi:hypothetical protein
MDEFKELDRELEKLRSELSLQDEFQRHFSTPAPGDYWRRRMDEEKALWDRKVKAGDEEKKALESKIGAQQQQMDGYNRKIDELQRKFEQEVRGWEDRLRIKEAEVLIEKNRLLSEQRIKEAEFENNELLRKIAALNADINRIKEEHAVAVQKLNEEFARERDTYEERIKAGQGSMEVLRGRITELENMLAEAAAAAQQSAKQYEDKIKAAEAETAQAAAENDSLKREKQGLAEEVTKTKLKSIEEKKQLENTFRESGSGFVRVWRKHLGSLMGVVQFVSSNKVKRSSWDVLKEMLGKMDEETQLLAAQASMLERQPEKYPAAVLADDEDFAVWEKTLAGGSVEIFRLNPKEWKEGVQSLKPRVLFASVKYHGLAKKINRRWKFLPVVISGDMKPGFMKKAMARGFYALSAPAADSELEAVLNTAAFRSAAHPDYWDRIQVKRSAIAPIAAVLLIAAAVTAGYVYYRMPQLLAPPAKVVSFATPYLQPTNLTFDGQNLWACDWYGQSIYKHKINGELGISRIFYFPNRHFSALAWAEGTMWSADAVDQKIYKHNSDDNLTITKTFDSPGTAPSGLAGNSHFIWSCDSAAAKIYKHNIDDTLSIAEEYPAPGTSPSGLYYDGKFLWSTDSKTNRIYRHDVNDGLKVTASYLAPNYETKGYNLSGISGNGKVFWVCSEKTGRIYQYPKESLK